MDKTAGLAVTSCSTGTCGLEVQSQGCAKVSALGCSVKHHRVHQHGLKLRLGKEAHLEIGKAAIFNGRAHPFVDFV